MLEKTDAYKEGMEAWDEHVDTNYGKTPKNPYPFNTYKWRAWNRGWNTNMRGID